MKKKKENNQESFKVVQVRVDGGSEYGGRADGEMGAFKLPVGSTTERT